MDNRTCRTSNQVVWGIVILSMGLLFLLDNLNLIEGRIIFRFWPVVLVVFGVLKVVQSPRHGSSVFGWGLIAVGAAMILHRLDMIYFRFRDWWPAILIIMGAGLLAKGWMTRKNVSDSASGMVDDSSVSASAFLGGIERKVLTSNFKDANLTAVMGGLKLDLRRAEMQGSESMIDVFAFWGGIEIAVPAGWSVSLQATPILGGFEDRTAQPTLGEGKKLVIRGSAIMGGVEIHN